MQSPEQLKPSPRKADCADQSKGVYPRAPMPAAAAPLPARPQPALHLTCLARPAIVLKLHASGAGARIERLPRGQQAQVGAAAIVLLTSRVDWGEQQDERSFRNRALDIHTHPPLLVWASSQLGPLP